MLRFLPVPACLSWPEIVLLLNTFDLRCVFEIQVDVNEWCGHRNAGMNSVNCDAIIVTFKQCTSESYKFPHPHIILSRVVYSFRKSFAKICTFRSFLNNPEVLQCPTPFKK